VLGVGGWRALEALGHDVDVCHLNEGHAALATIERARSFAEARGCDFFTALWATRGGNVFTTHTPVAAAFDTFPLALVQKYGIGYAHSCGIRPEQLIGLGRRNPGDVDEPFNMAYLAARSCARVNGVSELHGRVSRSIFAPLFPRWPEDEVPVTHVTNAVHVPSWDSPWADRLWTEACGKERWLGAPERLHEAVGQLSDAQLWDFRGMERRDLVDYARRRLQRQLSQRGGREESAAVAHEALDPNVLTLGFARRFTEYKRPTMLLSQPDRLARLLTDPERPVQLIIAGKAHPRDELGRSFVRQWAGFVRRPDVRARAVFLEDYDMALAENLVQGVDVWINTPRRPWEASGTSGMKVLVNGGLNLSELDGWWAEAYAPDVGWALGDGREHVEPGWDEAETEQLFALLEREVVPSFYDRDAEGIPRGWVARIRASLSRLTPRFSSNRMLAEYLDRLYLPAVGDFRRRTADNLHEARSSSPGSARCGATGTPCTGATSTWSPLRGGTASGCRCISGRSTPTPSASSFTRTRGPARRPSATPCGATRRSQAPRGAIATWPRCPRAARPASTRPASCPGTRRRTSPSRPTASAGSPADTPAPLETRPSARI
jgi:starch phosphorylase